MNPPTIALITDFGQRDGFVGIMKGVILSITPDVLLVDVANEIPPQDVRHGSWVLEQAYDWFPEGTFFLAVVDPGVGDKAQRKLVLYSEDHKKTLILPDNGLATRVAKRYPRLRCFSIENQLLFHHPVSLTFHGRDIYAPVAAHMAKAFYQNSISELLTSLGAEISPEELVSLELKAPQRESSEVFKGEIDIVDRYGNLITNIPASWLKEEAITLQLELNGNLYELSYASHYGAIKPDYASESHLIAVCGSHGMLEIASYGCSAGNILKVGPGAEIVLTIQPPSPVL